MNIKQKPTPIPTPDPKPGDADFWDFHKNKLPE
jgi:hypothetical protein